MTAGPSTACSARKVLLAATGAVFGVLRFLVTPSLGSLALGAVLVAAGYFVPDFLLDMRARRNAQDTITRELADTLDQITVCVEAGLGFEAAVARTTEKDGPLAP